MKKWNSPETAPRDEMFIANVGIPWAVFALWNNHENQFIYAGTEINHVIGRQDPYFGTEYINTNELIGWLPLPECP